MIGTLCDLIVRIRERNSFDGKNNIRVIVAQAKIHPCVIPSWLDPIRGRGISELVASLCFLDCKVQRLFGVCIVCRTRSDYVLRLATWDSGGSQFLTKVK